MSTKRWMDSESAEDELAREVLRAGLDVGPPEGAERHVWRKVASVVGAPAHPGGGLETGSATATATGTVTHAGATLSLLAKGFAVGVGVSALVAVAPRVVERGASSRAVAVAPSSVTARSRERVTRSPVAPAPVVASSSAADRIDPVPTSRPPPVSQVRPDAVVGQPARAASVPASAAFPLPADGVPRRTSLAAEAALLQKARSELRAGAIGAAAATLESSRQKFSAPELDQEREALAIELLYRSGRVAPASARARAFLQRYPESPHVSRVRSFLAAP
jgi:hypothetical protein